MPVQVEEPSMRGLVIEVHPHRQHDVVAPVVLRLGTDDMKLLWSFATNIIVIHYNQDHHPYDHKHHQDNLPDFLPFQQIASSGLPRCSPNRALRSS